MRTERRRRARRSLAQVFGVGVLVSLILALAGCAGEATTAPAPTVVAGLTATPAEVPTSGAEPVNIMPTPTSRPRPPTPTAVLTSPPLPTVVEAATRAVPTSSEVAGAGTPTAPLPSATVTREPVSSDMVSVPGGEFVMGSTTEDERPPHAVAVEAFEIDRTEVTNEAFGRFVDETGYQTEAEVAGEQNSWRTYAEGEPRHPVVKVTWNDAQAYCRWAGKRLPTEAEWEKAARGVEPLTYPWGNQWEPDRTNSRESGYRGTTVVGSFPQGASPYGALDMAGNVAEWTTDWYKGYPGGDFSSPYFGEQFRVIRGGGWFSDAKQVRTTARSASSEDLRNDDVGFRCVGSP